MKLESRDLRIFGLVLAAFIGLLWLLFRPALPWQWLAATELIVVLAALFVPMVLKPVHWLLSKLSQAVSKVLNPLILGIVFFLVVTPMGVVMRLFGYDPMAMKSKAVNGTYRKTTEPHKSEHFERPF